MYVFVPGPVNGFGFWPSTVATRDEIREIGPSHLAEQRGYPRLVQSSAASHDEQRQRWLWAVSEQSMGVTCPV